MRTWRTVISLALLMVCSTVVLAGDEEPLEVRDYQIDGLLALTHEAEFERLGIGWASYWDEAEDDGDELSVLGFGEANDLVELIRSLIAPTSWEEEGALLRTAGGRLTVHARGDVQRAVEALLAQLWSEALTRIRIDARFVTLDADALALLEKTGHLAELRSGRLGREAATAVLAQHPNAAGGTAHCVPGVRASIRQLNSVSYVRDFSVEIAQGSIVGDPIVDLVREGVLLDVTPHLLLDGGLFLEVIAQTSSLVGPIRQVNLEADALGSVDLPACRLFRSVSGGRLAAGESLAIIREDGSGTMHVLLVTPRIIGSQPVQLLPVSALVGKRSGYRLTDDFDDEENQPERYPPLLVRQVDDRAFITMDELVELLRSRVLSSAREEEPLLLPVGHRLATQAAPEIEQTMRRQLLALEAEATRTWRARIRVLAVDPDGAEKLLGAVNLAAPAGRAVCVGSVVERAYVADWDVEVAQESRIGDPNIGHAFGGVVMNLKLLPTGSPRAIAAQFDMILSDLDDVIETRRTGNAVTGIIEIPKSRLVRIERELVLVPGETQIVDGGTGPNGRRLRIEITVE